MARPHVPFGASGVKARAILCSQIEAAECALLLEYWEKQQAERGGLEVVVARFKWLALDASLSLAELSIAGAPACHDADGAHRQFPPGQMCVHQLRVECQRVQAMCDEAERDYHRMVFGPSTAPQ